MLSLNACGAPVLRNAPRPDPSAMAFGTAVVASVLTLLDPESHHRAIEQAYRDGMPEPRPQRVTEVVTSDVLDRLDAAIQNRKSL